MPESRRLLVLALDAASPTLLRRWAADGTLPNLARLMNRGCSASTRSVEGLFVGATWPSFFMGCEPGEHGIYWLDRVLNGTYRIQRAGPEELGRLPALWDLLSEAGHRVVVLDVPLAPISDRVAGPQIVEWGVHDSVFGLRTRPKALEERVLRDHGRHPAPAQCDAVRTPDEAQRFADQLVAGAEARAGLTLAMLESEPDWSFAIQVFSETHCAGHQLWHTHDPRHPAHAPGMPDLVAPVFRAVDAALGRIVDAVGPHTTVAVMALHGMGPAGGHSLLLQEVLRRLGIETPEGTAQGSEEGEGDGEDAPGTSRDGILRRLYRLLPETVRLPIYEARERRNQRLGRGSPVGIEPGRTRAFYVGLGTGAPFSAIRLNVRGREPGGVLAPGEETERFVRDLTDRLTALRDPRTGRPAVLRVVRARDAFDGPRVDELPDLMVEWDMSEPRGTTAAGGGTGSEWELESDELGRLAATNDYCRTGEHRRDGLLVLAGPGVEPGALERPLDLQDLAPTFAAMLEVATPTMRGRPVPELLGGGPGPGLNPD